MSGKALKPIKDIQDPRIFMAARFRSSKKKAFSDCLALAKRASFFAEAEEDGVLYNYVGFDRSPKMAALIVPFLSSLKNLPGHLCFFEGQIEKVNWRLINVMECYSRGAKAKDQKAYCEVYTERLFEKPHFRLGVDMKTLQNELFDEDEETPAMCPCKEIEPFLMLSRKSPTPMINQIQALAEDKRINLCPLFNPDGFKEILPEPKKYWD